jgi:Fe-S-cluster containining protein
METGEWMTGKITLSANGIPVTISITVPAVAVKPRVMLPVFQRLANSFTDLGVSLAKKAGEKIYCKAGCGACCSQPVPLAEIEVYHLAELVHNMPEPRRSVIAARFEAAATHFEALGWPERMEAADTQEALQAAVREYFFAGIPCPFLEKGSCSIYESRPVRCREFMALSPAIHCADPLPETVREMPMPLQAFAGLQGLGRGESLPPMKFIPLVLALRLAQQYPERFSEKTGEEWLGEFFSA